MRVIVTRHARDRHLEYTGREVNRHSLRSRLKVKLASGAKVTKGRVIFPAGNGLWAVCAPVMSGWVVITFLKTGVARHAKTEQRG